MTRSRPQSNPHRHDSFTHVLLCLTDSGSITDSSFKEEKIIIKHSCRVRQARPCIPEGKEPK